MAKETTWKGWLTGAGYADHLDPELAKRSWDPSAVDRDLAWGLRLELETRVATRPLHYRSGDERGALQSLRDFFVQTRESIRKTGKDGAHTGQVAQVILNELLRDFMALWHQRSEQGRLYTEDERHAFREQLEGVAKDLRYASRVLLAVALNLDSPPLRTKKDAEPLPCDGPGGYGPWTEAMEFLGPQPHAGRGKTTGELLAEEREFLRKRRAANSSRDRTREGCIGLAISGGGIRSAIFSLGVLQVMEKRGVLPHLDYLSTVSGGGYVGALLSSCLGLPDSDDTARGDRERGFLRDDCRPLQKLRDAAKYHLWGGSLAQTVADALLRILLSMAVSTMWVVLFVSALLVVRIGVGAIGGVLPVGAWAGLGLLAGVGLAFRNAAEKAENLAVVRIGFLALIGLAGATLLHPYVAAVAEVCPKTLVFLTPLLFLLPPVAGAIVAMVVPRRMGGPVRMLSVWSGVPLGVLLVYGIVECEVLHGEPWVWGLWGALTVGAVFALYKINLNGLSLRPIYEARLKETFLSEGPSADAKLSEIGPDAPLHLFGTAVNLPGSDLPALRLRQTDHFVLSPVFCGSPATGYVPTKDLESQDPGLTVARAVAVSGAATSSHTGRLPLKSSRLLRSAFGLRLDYWLPNPFSSAGERKKEQPSAWKEGRREILGRMDQDDPYLNLSDGGHVENLGLIELIRRKVRFAIVVDGEADGQLVCDSLLQCVHYARVAMDTTIQIDLSEWRLDAGGNARSHFQLGTIDYGVAGKGVERGYLLVIKLSMTGDEPPLLKRYRELHPSYPHESTADQFFTGEQFEAYRALGEHIAQQLFRRELMDSEPGSPKDFCPWGWLDHLRSKLFPSDFVDTFPEPADSASQEEPA